MKRFAVALGLLLLGTAGAAACERARPALETVAAVPASAWRDSAKFSFLIGRDYAEPQVRMMLMSGLRDFHSFAELRDSAQRWISDYLEMNSLTQPIAQAGSLADRLTTLCNILDRAAVLDQAFDKAAWLAELRDVTARVDRMLASGAALRGRLKHYSDLVLAAADHYGRVRHPAVDDVDIGPDPAAVASSVANIHGRWHAIFADLEFARASLPSGPEGGSEATIQGVAVAAAALRKAASQAAAISANYLPLDQFKIFADGDYLYEACAEAESRLVRLANHYWPNHGVLTLLNGTVAVDRGGQVTPHGQWFFRKDGNGYWTLNPAGAIWVLLDLPAGAQGVVTLTANPALVRNEPSRMSQRWRCYPSRMAGYVRFVNATMGEGRAVDTYSDSSQAIMADTGNFSGQYWRILP